MSTVLERTQPSVRTASVIAGITALIGIVANLVLLAIGQLAGAELVATNGGVATQIGVAQVVFGSVLPLVAGFIALVIATRWGARAWALLAWTGLVFAVLTAPMALTAQASAGTAVVLGAMHVTVGAAWFFLIRKSLADNA